MQFLCEAVTARTALKVAGYTNVVALYHKALSQSPSAAHDLGNDRPDGLIAHNPQ